MSSASAFLTTSRCCWGTTSSRPWTARESDQFEVGARVTTDVAAAQRVIDKLEAAARRSGADTLVRKQVDGDLVVASTAGQANRLATSGTLGDVAAFRKAMPDLAEADLALWVDPLTVVRSVFGGDGSPGENLERVDGVGVTLSSDGADSATYRFRLVAH